MIAPPGSNGDALLISTTKPVFFEVLFQFTLVPGLTQKREFPLAPGIWGVAEAEEAVLFTSTSHGVDCDPHVLPALQRDCGSGSVQAYLELFDWATAEPVTSKMGSTSKVRPIEKDR
jgi:hypothetical protein